MQQYDPLVRKLYEDGHPVAYIMAEVGISEPTVYKALRRAGGQPVRLPNAGGLSQTTKALLAKMASGEDAAVSHAP